MSAEAEVAATFAELVTPRRLTREDATGRSVCAFEVPDGWQQGRGAFGGLVIGMLARAMEAHEGDEGARTLRSISAELPGATMPGPAEVFVETLRRGSGQSAVHARLVQAGEVKAFGGAVLGRDREAPAFVEATAPRLQPPDALAPLPVVPGVTPVFLAHLELRPDTPFPFTRGPEAVARGWARLKRPGAARDAAFLAAHADAYWPSAFARYEAPRPAATVSFHLVITGDFVGLDPDAPLAFEGRTVASHRGYLSERRDVFGVDGRLLATNQQAIAVIA